MRLIASDVVGAVAVVDTDGQPATVVFADGVAECSDAVADALLEFQGYFDVTPEGAVTEPTEPATRARKSRRQDGATTAA